MRTWNFRKGQPAGSFLRIFVCFSIALALVTGGMALNPQPAQAITITATPAATITVSECEPFEIQFSYAGNICAQPPDPYYWTWGPVPGWVDFDWQTGLLTGCAPIGADTTGIGTDYIFAVGVTEYDWASCDPPCPCLDGVWVTITVNAAAPGTLIINPTPYEIAWEGAPFSMTLSATGCSGTYIWSATGLPAWATLDPATGIISGTPGPGTCNFADNVTVTCTDDTTCDPACCPPVSRSFFLYVDCWANYLPIFYYTTACDYYVEIGGLTQGQTNLLIDSSHEATLTGGQTYAFTSIPCESHTVMVDQTVQPPNSNIRFSVVGSNMKTLTTTDNHAYFNYEPEVYIQTASEPSGVTSPPGTGNYPVGSYFSSTVPGTVEPTTQQGTSYVFGEFRLPDGTTQPTTNVGFTVNQGGTVTAAYNTYYELTLHSDYPPIHETSLELAGSTATWDLSLHAVPMESSLLAFLGGTISPVNSSGSQLMTGPSDVEIQWRSNYTGPIIAIVIILLVIVAIVLIVRTRRTVAPPPAAKTKVKKTPPRVKKGTTKRTSK